MTPLSLAEILGVSRQAVSQYESGAQTPRPEVMEKLPAALNVRHRYFFRPLEEGDSTPLFFRSLAAATKDARNRAHRRQEWLLDVLRFIEQLVELPKPDIPAFQLPPDPRDINVEAIESAATNTRRHWGLGDGVISDIVLLLENKGAIVARGELWSEHLDAFSRWHGGRPLLFLASEKGSAVRSRFDAAHELAHLVLHRGVGQESLRRPEIFKLIEWQANRFASAFLMPADRFLREVQFPTLEGFRALKPIMKVSIGAMLKRAIDLGMLPADTPLWRSYARRGWRREEPLDREIPPEQPRLLRRAMEVIVRDGGFDSEQILNRFDIPAKDIEELANLPVGFLEPREPSVRLLTLKAREHGDEPAQGSARSTEPPQPARESAVLKFPSRPRGE